MCEIRKYRWRVDLTGKKVGKLTCIERAHKVGSHYTWKCICDCGNICYPYQTHLLRDNTKSCGCLQRISGEKNRCWGGFGEISGNIWSAIKRDRRQRGKRDFTITIEYAWGLFLNQNRKCALSGLELTFDQNGQKKTASLDRIDSNLGYIEGNVQWVHKDINIMKNIYPQDYFINMCSMISNNCSGGSCEIL